MLHLRAFPLVVLLSCAGCAANVPLRVLSSEQPFTPRPEPERLERDEAAPRVPPRIGAPGGSGAGSRSVIPAQSGNDAVGGLPAGIGGGTAPRG